MRVLRVGPLAQGMPSSRALSTDLDTGHFFVEKSVSAPIAPVVLSHARFDVVLIEGRTLLGESSPALIHEIVEAVRAPAVVVLEERVEGEITREAIEIGEQHYLIRGEVDESIWMAAIIYAQSRLQINRELKGLREDLRRSNRELESTNSQLIQAEKLEALGQLAAGIAHEVKNPLSRILLAVDYLNGVELTGDENIPSILEELSNAARRASEIIRGMVDFSSASKLQSEPEDVNEVLHRAVMMLQHEVTAHSVDLQLGLGKELTRVEMDSAKIEQVLVNVLLNAIQAVAKSPGRLVRASTGTERIDSSQWQSLASDRHPPPPHGTVVAIRVEDEGPGISEDDLPHLFDPFYTTKPSGEGTGLGLTVCRKIIDLHGGNMSIQNRPERGALVSILLPVSGPPEGIPACPPAPGSRQ